MKILNFSKKVCGLALPLFLSAGTLSAQDWTRISYVDFGGNSIEDPQFRVTPLTEEEGSTSLVFSAGPTMAQKYMLLKHFGEQRPQYWSIGGDHTNNENTELGYFMAIDCPVGKIKGLDDFVQGDRFDYPKDAIYSKELTNVEEGMTFKFDAFYANMDYRDPSSSGSGIAFGLLDKDNNVIWQSSPIYVPESGKDTLFWQRFEFEYVADGDYDSLYFKIYPVQGNYPGAQSNGFDFALDDISIFMETIDGKPLKTREVFLCEGETFQGEKYTAPGVYTIIEDGYKSYLNVRPRSISSLDTIICQGAVGKGEVAFSHNGVDYINDGVVDKVFKVSDVLTSVSGCDSIIEINVTIHPIEELTLDTMICKGDSLFGQYWNESGLFLKKMSMPIEMSRFGCPGNSLSYHVKVSDVNLKIRAAHNNNEIVKGQSVELLANSIGDIVNLTWGHNESLHDAEIIVAPENTTTYMAVAVDDIGCSATDSITIVVLADTIAATELIDAEVFDAPVNIYSINGALLKNNVILKEVAATLPDGLYIVGNKKVYIRRK